MKLAVQIVSVVCWCFPYTLHICPLDIRHSFIVSRIGCSLTRTEHAHQSQHISMGICQLAPCPGGVSECVMSSLFNGSLPNPLPISPQSPPHPSPIPSPSQPNPLPIPAAGPLFFVTTKHLIGCRGVPFPFPSPHFQLPFSSKVSDLIVL